MGKPIPETTHETNSGDFSRRTYDAPQNQNERNDEREDAPSAAPHGAISDRPDLYPIRQPGEGLPEPEPRDPTQGYAGTVWGDVLKNLSPMGTRVALQTFTALRLDDNCLTVRAPNTHLFDWEQEKCHQALIKLVRPYGVYELIVEPPRGRSLLEEGDA
jgi:hypothetical protein